MSQVIKIIDALDDFFAQSMHLPAVLIVGDQDWDLLNTELKQMAATDTGVHSTSSDEVMLFIRDNPIKVVPAFARGIRMPYGLILSRN